MLASSAGHAWKFMLPLLTTCRYHHCLVLPKPLSRIGKPSITDKCLVRIKTFFNPLSENFRKTSTSASNCSLLKCSSGPLSCQLSPAYTSSPVMSWKSLECRHASTDSTKNEDKFKIIMATSILKELRHAPTPALVLGISGLIPFVSFPVYMFMSDVYMPEMALAQATYGAVILSFLGGVRWGTAISYSSIIKPDWNNLGQAVVPSLAGWSAIQLSCPASTMILAGGFACLAYYDMAFTPYLPWFRALRLFLSGIAVLALCSDLLCYLILLSSADKAKRESQTC
ncbi:transmembrane protein 69 [Octopus bimaculoides]|uniref:Transmembrane protein 69 n=1 Tax=Octopus bimaculoides TaxID=37653 RepID=A0A0L8G169_OCTBM|nr:transmembrane protein 69 [Octopus bimaculoides]XP_014785344.1 transmembrane protein 69 [Octopus bimaculoides]|eukprot:XP_014785343.1 PREDICTED: transmembrane protein 69-like [Octopus bimaculoides]